MDRLANGARRRTDATRSPYVQGLSIDRARVWLSFAYDVGLGASLPV